MPIVECTIKARCCGCGKEWSLADEIKCSDCADKTSKDRTSLGQLDGLVSCKMTPEELVKVFEDEGMMITMGAQYSVKGQIAQLLNGLKKLGICSS